jgi:ubiquinone/menaquinone biosynthesis C-methylase UbiE
VTERRDHYSYRVYADPATARTFDARRFGGPIGELVAGRQAEVVLAFLDPPRGCRVLDVGTGTGRAALLLAREGAQVTGVDASEEMLAVARHRAAQEGVDISFETGDAHALAFAARSFDAVVGLRLLMHATRWRECLSELCRVADRRVVIDYPSSRSLARLQSAARRLLHGLGRSTEPYRVFSDCEIAEQLERSGFRVRRVERQFVLPIALHKALGVSQATEAVERRLRRVGLLRLFGSPVTILAERA